MKVYVYTEAEVESALVGLPPTWQDCPSTVERVTGPADADAFFVPLEVGHIEVQHSRRIKGVLPTLARLPHWGKHERRHFFYMHSDEDAPIGTQAIVFRQSVNKHNKDSSTVAMPAPVDDFGHLAGMDYEQLLYHVCFVGYQDDPRNLRRRCIDALMHCSRLNCYIDVVDKHWYHFEGTPEGDRRRQIFIDALKQSRLILAPRGKGQHSYRLFEAMSAGRIPILVGDDYELPFQEYIDYDACIIKMPEGRVDEVHEFILDVNERCRPLSCMADMARRCREAWVNYLAFAKWDEMVLRYLEVML